MFKSSDGEVSLPVSLDAETVWLTQAQMAQLFGKDRTVIGKHIRNAIQEGEVDAATGCANFAYPEENATGVIKVTAYNLDFVISVGYRVRSLRGVEFRRWATSVLKEYLINGVAINRKRLRQLGETVELMKRVAKSLDVEQVLDVVSTYSAALDLLDAYDHQTIGKPKTTAQRRLEAHRRPYARRAHGDDRRIQARREGDDGQPRHDVFGVKSADGARDALHHLRDVLRRQAARFRVGGQQGVSLIYSASDLNGSYVKMDETGRVVRIAPFDKIPELAYREKINASILERIRADPKECEEAKQRAVRKFEELEAKTKRKFEEDAKKAKKAGK